MDIEFRQSGKKWIAEVWSSDVEEHFAGDFKEPYPEETYITINDWCVKILGYQSRTAYNIFEFRTRSHLDWFLLRWQ